MTLNIPRGSIEYVTATITADVTLDMPAELSLSRGNLHNWVPATWENTPAETRNLRTTNVITFGDAYPHTSYTVMIRLADNPEAPLINAGSLYIT